MQPMATLFNVCGAPFTPHRFDDVLLREPDRLAFIIERDHAEALQDDWAWTLGRSLEAMALVPAPEPCAGPPLANEEPLRLVLFDGGRA
jgi:hypothetical protein